jgi:hypothetical protein
MVGLRMIEHGRPVRMLVLLRAPNPHIGFFEHPHMVDLMQVLNPRLRR